MRICLEQSAFPGVIRVTEKVAHDVELVSGKKPQILVEKEIPETLESSGEDWTIIAATKGKSSFLKKLEEAGSAELKELEQKRECYAWIFPEIKNRTKSNLLVIAGSDKRGTIYGLFHLSEMLGVSPFVDWCGLMPPKQEKIELREDMACISKEPSVRYRGFFINDEWPAFGNWCNHNFGGFNAKAYDHVFELLLRLKGNYLWPAMWSARFADDGPDLLNAELADEYGIIMGMSHHEPCLRQGEEYKYLRGKNSVYGDAWNFRTNREGITKFWEDGLKRSGKFENVITVGMRGEADTAIMGKNATLEDNIQLLRDVLKTQKKLIQERVNPDLTKVPRMIALYKEVEEFFYGNEKTKGLMGAEELEDVILMLCDDNYGNLRTLPTEEMRKHAGGYGMYYHLDYHGWPVSYEWINSSYLPKIWEQMSMAYDFGVRELWMVNVGDIATQEFPLSFFLDMAYDFDRWGSRALNCTQEYTRKWVRQQFGSVEEETQDTIADILEQYTKIIHRRRPEALNPETYHPVQEKESSRIFEEEEQLLKKLQDVYETIEKTNPQNLSAFIALVYYPAFGTMNLVKMQILAGWNHYYANLGAVCANDYGDEVERCMEQDRKAVEMYHQTVNLYGTELEVYVRRTGENAIANIAHDLPSILLLILINAILPFFFVHILNHSFTKRITELNEVFKSVDSEQLVPMRHEGGKDEIGSMIRSYNRMAARTNELIQTVYKNKLVEQEMLVSRKNAELLALHSQINPHFLFNALESIRMHSILKNENETADMVEKLAVMQRQYVEWGEDSVTIEQEVEFVKAYLALQKYRFGERLSYQIEIDEECRKRKVPKLTLVTFVENACVHGIESKASPGWIFVRVYEQNELICMEIEDTGNGMEEGKRQELLENMRNADIEMLKKKGRVGIVNACLRLKMVSENKVKIDLDGEEGVGTLITIWMPLEYM